MECAGCAASLPKPCIPIFSFRIKLMAEGELKDMEQFFDDLSDSFSGTEPEVHKTSVVGMELLRRAGSVPIEVSGVLRGICPDLGVQKQAD
jgi:hypothetical protein